MSAHPEGHHEEPAEPVVPLSRAMRRRSRVGPRILAFGSLVGAVVVTGLVIRSATPASTAPPIATATAPAWAATAALSDALRELRPGDSRREAAGLATRAEETVGATAERVEALELPTPDTPLRSRVLTTLRADAAWIAAAGDVLENPRSRRRAELAELAERAATGTALVGRRIEAAQGTVGGTGRLLAATRPG